jgi:hypothetical protein
MKRLSMLLVPAVFAVSFVLNAAPVQAAGCLREAVVGGAAGHLMGHHALLGAGAGCLVGRHEANKAARDEGDRNEREPRW